MELPVNEIILGDCIEVLTEFPDNSMDCVVTDPPYGLEFMGKDWDKSLPPKEAFEQIIRVLKPGALCFVMSSPRQDLMWRMMKLLEDVGFNLEQSFLSWIYKTGFPKAYDVSKGIDKKFGEKREIGGEKIAPDGVPYSKRMKEGHGPSYGDLVYGDYDNNPNFTVPSSDLAKKWDGWKSIAGLKPALEPILMVNKPLTEHTIVDNVLKWGVGAINIDGCRIPIGEIDAKKTKHNWKPDSEYKANESVYEFGSEELDTHRHNKGRFPANLLVSDKAIDTGEITESTKVDGSTLPPTGSKGIYGKYDVLPTERGYNDAGDQSRYFDLDAWAKHHGILDVPKPSRNERDKGLDDKNTHPTVKPIKLMAYLIELGCPQDGVVLDPFVGSGTTCIAAKKTARKFIGIEINENYHRIAEARLVAYPTPLDWLFE